MLQNKQTLQAALEEKFGNAAFNFTETNGVTSFFINPSSQTAIFNFLVYEDQWKYDVLKDVNLLYEPDHAVSEYMLVYNIASKLHKEEHSVYLPVAFSDGKANSLVHLYKTAEKFEQIVTEVYGINFVSKKVKLDDFAMPKPGIVTELVTAEVNPADYDHNFATELLPERKPERTVAAPIAKTKKDAPVVAKVITSSATNFAESLTAKQETATKERRSSLTLTGGKFLTALPSYKLPEETRFKVLYYLTPLVIAAAIFLFIRLGKQAEDESTALTANNSTIVDDTKPVSSSLEQSDYNVIVPTGSNNKPEKLLVNTPAANLKELQKKEKEKEKKKQELLASGNENAGLPLVSQPSNTFTPGSEIAPVSFVATEKESKSFAPVSNMQEAGNIKTPPVTQQLTAGKKEEATVVSSATQKPEYPGGSAAMAKYLRRKLQMPDEAVDNNVDGNVVVRFMVDANGNISNVELSKKIGYGCDEVVERAIQSMPKWIPGKINGSTEAMPVKLSVKFLTKGNQPTP
jgi:TonB family protein